MAELAIMAATAAGASAGTAATIGTVASIGLTAASAFSSIQAGNAEAANLKVQARQSDLNARQETLRGKQQVAQIQTQLDRDLASQNALFGARGLIKSEGSALAAREVSSLNASKDIDLARFDADIASLDSQQQATNLKSQASAAKRGGVLNAIQTVGGLQMYGIGKDANGQTVPIPKRKPSMLFTG